VSDIDPMTGAPLNAEPAVPREVKPRVSFENPLAEKLDQLVHSEEAEAFAQIARAASRTKFATGDLQVDIRNYMTMQKISKMLTGKKAEETARDEHNPVALSKRSLMVGFDGSVYRVVNVDANGNLLVSPGTPPALSTPVTARDTNFIAGESPFLFDVNTALSRNGTQFLVVNDGNGDFSVSVSNDGIAFGDEHVLERDEIYELEGVSVDTLRFTLIGPNSAYRAVAL